MKGDKMKRCIIWGAGEWGRKLLEKVYWLGYDVVAYCDMNSRLHGGKVRDVPIIGKEETLNFILNDGKIEIIVGVLDEGLAEEIRLMIKEEFPENVIIRNGIGLTTRHLAPIMVPTDIEHMLAGKVALITGGGSGIGYAIAELFLKAGCKCIISGRDNRKLLQAKEMLRRYGGEKVQTLSLDVLRIHEMESAIEKATGLFEEKQIHILVNNAGVIGTKNFLDMDEEEYDRIMDTNLKGTVFMTKVMGNYMIKNQIRGHIINICSSASLAPATNPYRMSKWAVRGFTLGAAKILSPHGITVNAVAPGPTAFTGMGSAAKHRGDSIYCSGLPTGRDCVPEEIAAAVLYLASGFRNQSTGEILGMTAGDGNLLLR